MPRKTLSGKILALGLVCAGLVPQSANAQFVPSAPKAAEETAPSDAEDLKGYQSVNDLLPVYISETAPFTYTIRAGSRFVVSTETGFSSATAAMGDALNAKFVKPLEYAGYNVIPAGAEIKGSISLVDHSRHSLRADLPGKHWLNAQGAIGITFNSLEIGAKNFPLSAIPAPKSSVSAVAASRFPIVVDKEGDLTVYYGNGKYATMSLAIEGGSMAAGPFGLLLGPALSGIAGAASPSYALGHPSDAEGFKARSKGFFLGMVKGLPGGGLLTGAVEHGSDVALVPGDEFIIELKSDLVIIRK